MIPKYILEGITETNRFGIGLLNVDEKEDTAQAVGALIFDMLDGTNEEEEDLLTSLIRWFYIAEEYDQLCSYLQTWDFEFGITDDYGLIIQLKDFLKDIKLPKLNTAEIIPLSEIHASSFREYIERLRKKYLMRNAITVTALLTKKQKKNAITVKAS